MPSTTLRVKIDKDELYSLYFDKMMNKKQICAIFKCSEKVLDLRFKRYGWEFRKAGTKSAKWMQDRSVIKDKYELILRLYKDERKTCLEIGNIFGLSESAIARFLKKRGVSLRQLRDAQVKQITNKLQKDTIFDMYVNKKMSCMDIAQEFNCGEEPIRRCLINFGIERRDRTESLAIYQLDDLDAILMGNHIIRITKMKSLSEIKNRSQKIEIKCLLDGHEWKAQVKNLLQGSGCPICRYKGEKSTYEILLEILTNNKITPQYKLCNYNGNDNKRHDAIVDFYIRTKNKNIVVEYNGKQHYTPVKWNKTQENHEENFQKQLFRDNKVREFCKNNNIYLVEIDGRNLITKENIKKYILEKLKGEGIL